MNKFFMVVGENVGKSHGGKFETLQDAKEFASESSLKHLKNDGYIVLEAVHYTQSTVTIYTDEFEIKE